MAVIWHDWVCAFINTFCSDLLLGSVNSLWVCASCIIQHIGVHQYKNHLACLILFNVTVCVCWQMNDIRWFTHHNQSAFFRQVWTEDSFGHCLSRPQSEFPTRWAQRAAPCNVCAEREREVKIARDKIDETSCLISFSRVCMLSPREGLSFSCRRAHRAARNEKRLGRSFHEWRRRHHGNSF